MPETFRIRSRAKRETFDVTDEVRRIVRSSGATRGLCHVMVLHATAAIVVNENDDPNIGVDLLRALNQVIPEHDGWLHDRVDNNAAAHIKSAIIGPSETIPIIDGQLALGTWQNVFFVELDGPRRERRIIVSIVS